MAGCSFCGMGSTPIATFRDAGQLQSVHEHCVTALQATAAGVATIPWIVTQLKMRQVREERCKKSVLRDVEPMLFHQGELQYMLMQCPPNR